MPITRAHTTQAAAHMTRSSRQRVYRQRLCIRPAHALASESQASYQRTCESNRTNCTRVSLVCCCCFVFRHVDKRHQTCEAQLSVCFFLFFFRYVSYVRELTGLWRPPHAARPPRIARGGVCVCIFVNVILTYFVCLCVLHFCSYLIASI